MSDIFQTTITESASLGFTGNHTWPFHQCDSSLIYNMVVRYLAPMHTISDLSLFLIIIIKMA